MLWLTLLFVGATDPATLDAKLTEVSRRHGVPGMAALAVTSQKDVARAVTGVRKLGDSTPVGPNDKWHLGSDTKAMTATLAAVFVESDKIAWSTKVTDVFSDWKDIHPAFAQVTLEALLQHRAGLPANPPQPIKQHMRRTKDPAGARQEAVHAMLREAPSGKLGTFAYSNVGYMVAGAMLQKVGQDSWESLMQKRLFAPLGMSACGFGPPATPGQVDAPWAHKSEGGKLEPVEPGPKSDNPAALGPAGTVHCSLADWAKFIVVHLKGGRGEATPLGLSPATFAKLQTAPPGGQYAMGWGVTQAPWARGNVLAHDGSNTMFYVSAWVAPQSDIAFLVAANSAGDAMPAAVQEVVSYMAQSYAPRP